MQCTGKAGGGGEGVVKTEFISKKKAKLESKLIGNHNQQNWYRR